MLSKNQYIELEIIDIASDGNGVGKYEGMAIFVPNTAIGDFLDVKIIKVLKNCAYGVVEAITTASADRICADCGVYKPCGGCQLRHISYESELKLKQNWVYQNMKRIGGIDLACNPIIASPTQSAYRNKIIYPVQKDKNSVKIGFYAKHSHTVIDGGDCKLHPQSADFILSIIQNFVEEFHISIYDETTQKGLLRNIYLRYATITDEIMVCLVLSGDALPKSEILIERLHAALPTKIKTVCINTNTKNTNVILGDKTKILYGSGYITDLLCGIQVDISPLSFYQVNHDAAELLYEKAAQFAGLTGKETLIDLYCGAGTIGLFMAKNAKHLIGVEIVPSATEDANRNMLKNKITNAKFICADATKAAQKLLEENIRPDVVVLDPPRKGCDKACIQAVAKMQPEKIVMISCNSATLARDCKELQEIGYAVREVQPVDLFPRTVHVECVVLMSRIEK